MNPASNGSQESDHVKGVALLKGFFTKEMTDCAFVRARINWL